MGSGGERTGAAALPWNRYCSAISAAASTHLAGRRPTPAHEVGRAGRARSRTDHPGRKGYEVTNAEVETLADMVAYQPGSVVSRKIMGAKRGNVTVFAFAEGEGLTEHTSPYAARIVVLDGTASVRIADRPYTVSAGETLLLPAAVPHALDATQAFKMLLIMIREDAEDKG